jgi:hypothetical protein
MRDYKELLGLVSKVELTAPRPSVNYVRMEIENGEHLFVDTPRRFTQLLGEISGADTGVQPQQAKQKKPQPPQPPKPPQAAGKRANKQAEAPEILPEPPSWETVPEIVATQPEAMGKQGEKPKHRFGIRVPKPSEKPALDESEWVSKPEQKPVQKQKSLEQEAAAELSRTVESSEITPQQQPAEASVPSGNGLVLPTLSLIDQVSELDKIIDNVKNGRFDKYQMEIVREEVEGLSKEVSSQPQQAATGAPLDQDMLKLRRSRLSEALVLIQGS